MNSSKLLQNLNDRQREAANYFEGPLLILAGAGAGKTKTITHRIAELIRKGVEPNRILAVTFTNKAAKEMRERVLSEIGKIESLEKDFGGGSPFVSTFHALGTYLIRENARALGLNRHFSILDEGDSLSIIKDAMKGLGFDPKEFEPRKIKGVISREKGKCIDPETYVPTSSLERIVKEIWPVYENKKNKENGLDFDDLLIKALKLLEKNENIRAYYQEKWQYIHIDEYQDTNEVQYKMARILCGSHNNICVVGDADQNIYSWRGANLRNILQFEKDYKGAKVVVLEENYRSTQNILEAANEVIKKNKFRPEKNLFTKNKTGEKISLYEALDESDEADFIATRILELFDRGEENIAILYRANFQSRALEEAMLSYNIPYQVLGTKFFERKEVKDTLAYLRAALNPESLTDIKRIINFPARGIGKATLAKLFAGDKESLPIKTKIKIDNFYQLLHLIKEKIEESSASEAIKFLIKKSGIEDELWDGGEEGEERLENIKELATLALKYKELSGIEGVEKLLEEAALSTDQDDLDQKKENKKAVKLMTVHAAKGLEFDYVFITGLEEGLFPHERSGAESDAEEERRLFYVALTRAREKLFLSFANYRTIFGSRGINIPSQFLGDMPPHLVEYENENKKMRTIYL